MIHNERDNKVDFKMLKLCSLKDHYWVWMGSVKLVWTHVIFKKNPLALSTEST